MHRRECSASHLILVTEAQTPAIVRYLTYEKDTRDRHNVGYFEFAALRRCTRVPTSSAMACIRW